MALTDFQADPQRLQRSITLSSWWLMGQGVVLVITGERLSNWLSLRYHDNMVPYMNTGGLALLGLGLFVNRSVREASRQYLAVDTLLLFFLGQVILTLGHRMTGSPIFWFEWVSVVIDVLLAGALVLFRTRGSQMEAPGSLVALDVMVALKQAGTLLKAPTAANRAPVAAPLAEAPAEAESSAAAEPAPSPEATAKPKPSSEAMPHMD